MSKWLSHKDCFTSYYHRYSTAVVHDVQTYVYDNVWGEHGAGLAGEGVVLVGLEDGRLVVVVEHRDGERHRRRLAAAVRRTTLQRDDGVRLKVQLLGQRHPARHRVDAEPTRAEQS